MKIKHPGLFFGILFFGAFLLVDLCGSPAGTVPQQAPAAVLSQPETAEMTETTALTTSTVTEETTTETTAATVPPPVPVTLCAGMEYMSDTEDLDISGTDVTALDMDGFLSAMTGLKRIRMKNCGLDNDGYAALQDAHPDVRIIWDIKVKTYTIPTDSVGFSALLGNQYQARLYDSDTKYLQYCHDMIALDLGHHFVADLSFLQYMPNLRILILVDNYSPTGSGVRLSDISALKYVPHLRYLELFANNIEDMSVLAELKELEDLNICYNPVRDAAPLRDLPHLQRLWVYNTNIPAAEIQELREIYADAKVITSGTGSVDQGWRDGEHYWAMKNMVSNNVIDDVYRID